VIFHDENGAQWECSEVNGGSGAAVGDRDGKVFRRLQFKRADTAAAIPQEIIVSADLDLNDPAIQRWILKWSRIRV